MRRWIIKITLLGTFFLSCTALFSQTNTLIKVQDLNFGSFIPFNNGGTVTISTQGVRSASGSIALISSGPQPSHAVFTFTASGRKRFRANYTVSPTVLTGPGGATMSVTFSPLSPLPPYDIRNGETLTINLGATLNVGNINANPPGTYNGSFTLTLNYQ